MAKVTVEGVEYETEKMTDNAKAQLASLQFLEAHIQQIQNEIAIYQTARQTYGKALKTTLEAGASDTTG